MKVEETKFDNWLKDNLWRDLIFRSIIWILIALTAYFMIAIDAKAANEYFKGQSNLPLRLLNVTGPIAIFLGLVAMMFKDMEIFCPNKWGQDSFLGGIGGFFRRLAGDLTLWTLGALVSILLTITLYGFSAMGTNWKQWAIYSIFYLFIVGEYFMVALLNVYVRRAEAFVSTKFKNPNLYFVGFCYALIIIGCLVYLYYKL